MRRARATSLSTVPLAGIAQPWDPSERWQAVGLRCTMWELNEVVSSEYRQGHVYHVVFDDGLQGDVDFSEREKTGKDGKKIP